MRYLITGSAGFIGTHLCEELRRSGHTVDGWDRKNGEGRDILKWPGLFHERVHLGRYDAVVHLAAQVGRLFGEDNLAHTIASNSTMTAHVARICGVENTRLVYASTSEVYGDQGLEPLAAREDEALVGRIHNAYGLTKLHGEDFCRLYAPDGLTIWRISMPYGPGLPAGRGRAAMINFLYNALHGLPIQVHRNSERSWCWIGDTVRAMRLTLERTDGGTFNIGRDDNPVLMRELAEAACKLACRNRLLIEDVEPPARQTVVKRLDTSKIRALGWEPHVTLGEGVIRTFEYVKTLPAPGAMIPVAA